LEVREARHRYGLYPAARRIDTVAAEEPTTTNYLYLSYGSIQGDVEGPTTTGGESVVGKGSILILGSGAYHIGSSVEFDYTAVMAARYLRKKGFRVAILNMNPETVTS